MWPSPQIKSLMENIFVCSVQKKTDLYNYADSTIAVS